MRIERKKITRFSRKDVGVNEAVKANGNAGMNVPKITETFLSQKAHQKGGSKKTTGPVLGIKKEYLNSKNICKATFKLPAIAAPDAKSVYIVGDFNGWCIHADPMKKLKNGDYNIKLELETGKEYQFRYWIDDLKWENDWKADKYVKSSYGDCDNSVVVV